MPYYGGGGIGGPRTRKGRPKTARSGQGGRPVRTRRGQGEPVYTLPSGPRGDIGTEREGYGGRQSVPRTPRQKRVRAGSYGGATRRERRETRQLVDRGRRAHRRRRARALEQGGFDIPRQVRRRYVRLGGPGPTRMFNYQVRKEGRARLRRMASYGAQPYRPPPPPATRVAGIGGPEINRFIERNVTGRQTIFGGVARGGWDLAGPVAKDIATLPITVPTGAYYTGRAGYKAIRGDSSELKYLGEQFVKHDPIALAIQGQWDKAMKEFTRHPGLTALEVYGGVGTAARLTSRASRMARGRGRTRQDRTHPNFGLAITDPILHGPQGAVQRVQRRGGRKRELTARDWERAVDESQGLLVVLHRQARGERQKQVAREVFGTNKRGGVKKAGVKDKAKRSEFRRRMDEEDGKVLVELNDGYWKHLIGETAYRTRGRTTHRIEMFDTVTLAEQAATRINSTHKGVPKLVPVRVNYTGAAGNYALIPKIVSERIDAHVDATKFLPGIKPITEAFRRTVLPFSTTWLTGNVAEGVLRAAIKGAGPASWVRYRKVYNELARKSPEEAARMLAATPGAHYAGVELAMKDHLAILPDSQGIEMQTLGKRMKAFVDKPAVGEFVGVYRAVTDVIFTMNRRVEAQIARAMAGRYIKQELMPRAMRDDGVTAVQQAARGLKNTAEQRALARHVRRAYGQYESFTPGMRKMLNVSPFLPWTLNAVKFLTMVLPNDHPTLLAVLAAQKRVTEKLLQTAPGGNMDPFHEGAVPDFLRGTIPAKGGHIPLGRYTPFSLGANPYEQIANNMLPPFTGAFLSLKGLDWKGDQLRLPQDLRPLVAARELIYANVPAMALFARYHGLGQPERGANTFNPFRVYKNPDKGESTTGGEGGVDYGFGDTGDGGVDYNFGGSEGGGIEYNFGG